MFNNTRQRFGLRKLTVGLASVLLGLAFLGIKQNIVHADTISDGTTNTNMQTDNTAQPVIDKKTVNTNDDIGRTAIKISVQKKNQNISTNLKSETVSRHLFQTLLIDNTNSSNADVSTIGSSIDKTASTVDPANNGGFDSKQWGILDVSKWTGQVENGVYQLTNYTGDKQRIIVPNEADFAKAGKSTNGLQVGIDANLTNSWFSENSSNASDSDAGSSSRPRLGSNSLPRFGSVHRVTGISIAFSKTDNKKIKAIGSDWSYGFSPAFDRKTKKRNYRPSTLLSHFDGSALDTSGVTNMADAFNSNLALIDLTSLSNWNTSNVTDMSGMFAGDAIHRLTPLANWDIHNVQNMDEMFRQNRLVSLKPLFNWKTSNVVSMRQMFGSNSLNSLAGLENWDVSHVSNMNAMFTLNALNDLSAISNWDTSSVKDMGSMFAYNDLSDLSAISNWDTSHVKDMSSMFTSNDLSNLSSISKWDVTNVNSMESMFERNKLSDLSGLSDWNVSNVYNAKHMFGLNHITNVAPLANWHLCRVADPTITVTVPDYSSGQREPNGSPHLIDQVNHESNDISYMFDHNFIKDVSPLANWDISNISRLDYMFADNPVVFADFHNWNFAKDPNVYSLFSSLTKHHFLFLANKDNETLVKEFAKYYFYGDETSKNGLLLDSIDTKEIPNVLVADGVDSARKQLLDQINNAISMFKNNQNTDLQPIVPLDQVTDLVELANMAFVAKHTPIVIKFIDTDTNIKLNPEPIIAFGTGSYTLTIPDYYEVVGTLPNMTYGNTYVVKLKHKIRSAFRPETDNAERDFDIYYPDGTYSYIRQVIPLKYTQLIDAVTSDPVGKTSFSVVTDTDTPNHSFGSYAHPASGIYINGVKQDAPSYIVKNGKILFSPITIKCPPNYVPHLVKYKEPDKKEPRQVVAAAMVTFTPVISTNNTTVNDVNSAFSSNKTDSNKKTTSDKNLTYDFNSATDSIDSTDSKASLLPIKSHLDSSEDVLTNGELKQKNSNEVLAINFISLKQNTANSVTIIDPHFNLKCSVFNKKSLKSI